MPADINILTLDCYTDDAQDAIKSALLPEIGRSADLVELMLRPIDMDIKVQVHAVASSRSKSVPLKKDDLVRFDGVTISGSPLSVIDDDNPFIDEQVQLMNEIYEVGLPIFGICYGLQLTALAGGGTVSKNPNGIEGMTADNIHVQLLEQKMLEGRKEPFQAFSHHVDMVRQLPVGGEILASNSHTKIQAARFKCGNSEIWGTQYHPDYNPDFVRLVHEVTEHESPLAEDNWSQDIMDPTLRTNEIKNWLNMLKKNNLS